MTAAVAPVAAAAQQTQSHIEMFIIMHHHRACCRQNSSDFFRNCFAFSRMSNKSNDRATIERKRRQISNVSTKSIPLMYLIEMDGVVWYLCVFSIPYFLRNCVCCDVYPCSGKRNRYAKYRASMVSLVYSECLVVSIGINQRFWYITEKKLHSNDVCTFIWSLKTP